MRSRAKACIIWRLREGPGQYAGLCHFPVGWGHLPVPRFFGLLCSLAQLRWGIHACTEKKVTLCFSCAETMYSKQHCHIFIHCTVCELILFVDKSTSQRDEEREEGTGGCVMNTKPYFIYGKPPQVPFSILETWEECRLSPKRDT